MKVCEIFSSIQGESTYAGTPCTFVRLSGCNLRCSYCDTSYSYGEGEDLPVEEVLERVKRAGWRLVEITGGEPLLQKAETDRLARMLLDAGFAVLIETNGTISIADIDRRATVVMDVKTPGSGMSGRTDTTNFENLRTTDEVKFVLCDRDDYLWAKKIVQERGLPERCTVLFSPAFGLLEPRKLAEWVLEDRVVVRFNLQLHKYIFPPDERMV